MKQNGKHPMPPWLRDSSPQLWVPLAVAARSFYHKSVDTVRGYVRDGTITLPTYWDGTRWHIRLPYFVQAEKRKTREARTA